MMTPAAFAEGWRATHEAAPASAELQSAYGSFRSTPAASLP
jgi:hypothetical protein